MEGKQKGEMCGIVGMDETARVAHVTQLRVRMEALAEELRVLIAAQPPKELLGYLYGQHLLGPAFSQAESERGEGADPRQIDDNQFVLEYVHAVLAATAPVATGRLDEAAAAKIFELARELRATALGYCIFSAAGTTSGAFGPSTRDVEFLAKFAWVSLRGNRYQVLEEEFYHYALAPHDAALQRVYGTSAAQIAAGFQLIADTARTGHMRAAEAMEQHIQAALAYSDANGVSMDEAVQAKPENLAAAQSAVSDLLFGGICNVSKHAALPTTLLEDLSFTPGEEQDFFAPGEHRGTPLRTLPARRKPLIQLDDGHYAIDLCFIRDSGYRALLHHLQRRDPGYRAEFKDRQQAMSEAAFMTIFGPQLTGARSFKNVWYRVGGNWFENDLLVLVDDVLLVVEAKAGAAASIASPELDFARHVQSVQDLIVKAYTQCQRFLEYLGSADEVPIYNVDRVEIARFSRKDFRVVLPIGLTVESYSPFSAMCKDLPGITPLLGQHAFISLSIDDLLVLKRFLPTTGELMHYLEVRQQVAAIPRANLFDELDHLGAYLTKNRFDEELRAQFAEGATLLVWDGMSHVVDRHFEGEMWETHPVPAQLYPEELHQLLAALNRTRAPGWLALDSWIRDRGAEGRQELADPLSSCRRTLDAYDHRYFFLIDSPALFCWLQREGTSVDVDELQRKLEATRLAAETDNILVLVAHGNPRNGYERAERFPLPPTSLGGPSEAVRTDAERMKQRVVSAAVRPAGSSPPIGKERPGRNDPCWCNSGKKFKKCHGAGR